MWCLETIVERNKGPFPPERAEKLVVVFSGSRVEADRVRDAIERAQLPVRVFASVTGSCRVESCEEARQVVARI
jgi:hypothetical protein